MKGEPLLVRFERYYIPEPNSGCWLWIGAGNGRYGSLAGEDGRTTEPAHRISWKLFNGHLSKGINVLHRCDVTWCVNPDHLFLGTQADNVADMCRKGRHHKLCGEDMPWSKLTESVVRLIHDDSRSYSVIAKHYGISPGMAWFIKKEKVWKHLWVADKRIAKLV